MKRRDYLFLRIDALIATIFADVVLEIIDMILDAVVEVPAITGKFIVTFYCQ